MVFPGLFQQIGIAGVTHAADPSTPCSTEPVCSYPLSHKFVADPPILNSDSISSEPESNTEMFDF